MAESESVFVRSLRIAIGSGIGFMIAFICLLPPILHFVTGPLGPAIGGFVGGNKMRASAGEAVGIGLGMSAMGAVLLVLAGGVYELAVLTAGSDHASRIPDGFFLIAVLVLAYVAAFGTLGAIIGGAAGRRDTPSTKPAAETPEAVAR